MSNMKSSLAGAMLYLREELHDNGVDVKTATWQGGDAPDAMIELIHAGFVAPMYADELSATEALAPWQPWASDHFQERTGGLPLNPPPSNAHWAKAGSAGDYLSKVDPTKFSHSYPERMWASKVPGFSQGYRFANGDLGHLVEVLRKDPTTRQAYLPLWFPEDITAALDGERVPCTLGYHFMMREGQLHVFYPMRSLDAVRHLHNDLWFVNMLALWVIQQAGLDAVPGLLNFQASSLHCFKNDRYPLSKLIKKAKQNGISNS